MPRPLRRAGSAIRFLSMSLKAFCPVRNGSSCFQMASSSGLNRSSHFGMFLARYAICWINHGRKQHGLRVAELW